MTNLLTRDQRRQARTARKLLKSANLVLQIGSLDIVVEALERLLVEKGILKEDELMDRFKLVQQQRWEKDLNVPGGDD